MKSAIFLVAVAVALTAPAFEADAASNRDRIGLGNRKSEEQPPQASETRQFCTQGSVRVKTAGSEKSAIDDASQSASCSNMPASRTSEEARAEARKVERIPDN
jgi:hypothetical protein